MNKSHSSLIKIIDGDKLYFIEKGNAGYIECKAVVKEAISAEELDEEKTLNLILDSQRELLLTASQIKKWSEKPYLTFISFE